MASGKKLSKTMAVAAAAEKAAAEYRDTPEKKAARTAAAGTGGPPVGGAPTVTPRDQALAVTLMLWDAPRVAAPLGGGEHARKPG